jgi:hypothetical protein
MKPSRVLKVFHLPDSTQNPMAYKWHRYINETVWHGHFSSTKRNYERIQRQNLYGVRERPWSLRDGDAETEIRFGYGFCTFGEGVD